MPTKYIRTRDGYKIRINHYGGALQNFTSNVPGASGYNPQFPPSIFQKVGNYGIDVVNFIGPLLPEIGKFFDTITNLGTLLGDFISGAKSQLLPSAQLREAGVDIFARYEYLKPFDKFFPQSDQDIYQWSQRFYDYFGPMGKKDKYGTYHQFGWWYQLNLLTPHPEYQSQIQQIHNQIATTIVDEYLHPDKENGGSFDISGLSKQLNVANNLTAYSMYPSDINAFFTLYDFKTITNPVGNQVVLNPNQIANLNIATYHTNEAEILHLIKKYSLNVLGSINNNVTSKYYTIIGRDSELPTYIVADKNAIPAIKILKIYETGK